MLFSAFVTTLLMRVCTQEHTNMHTLKNGSVKKRACGWTPRASHARSLETTSTSIFLNPCVFHKTLIGNVCQRVPGSTKFTEPWVMENLTGFLVTLLFLE